VPRGYFASKAVELINHCVKCFFELENFAAHIDSDFAGKIPVSDRCSYLGNVTDLTGEMLA